MIVDLSSFLIKYRRTNSCNKIKSYGAQILSTGLPSQLNLVQVLSVKLPLCHPSGTQNFEVAPRFLENLCTSGLRSRDFHKNSLSVLFFNVRQFHSGSTAVTMCSVARLQQRATGCMIVFLVTVISFTFIHQFLLVIM